MPELLPTLNVPPLFELEPPAADANATTARAAMPRISAESHRFFILPSSWSSRSKHGFVDRERTPVGVERTTNAERKCGQMLAVTERQLVEHGHAERLQVLLQHVLERARARPVGRLPQVAPLAVLHLADDDPGDSLQLFGGCELGQETIQMVRRQLDVLEEEDRALRLELPRRPHRLHQEPQATPHERRGHLAAANRTDVGIVRIPRNLAGAPCGEDLQQPLARERRGLPVPDPRQAVGVEGGEAGALAD